MGTSGLCIFYEEDFPSRRPAGLRTRESGVPSRERAGCAERGENDAASFLSNNNQITATVRIQAAALHEP